MKKKGKIILIVGDGMKKKDKITLIFIAIFFILAAIISVLQIVMDHKIAGMQIGNLIALGLIGAAAVFIIIKDKTDKGD